MLKAIFILHNRKTNIFFQSQIMDLVESIIRYSESYFNSQFSLLSFFVTFFWSASCTDISLTAKIWSEKVLPRAQSDWRNTDQVLVLLIFWSILSSSLRVETTHEQYCFFTIHTIFHNISIWCNIWHVLSSCRMLSVFLVQFSKWLQSVKKVL